MGGEDAAVQAEMDALSAAGHDVVPEIVSNEDIVGVGRRLTTFLRAPYDRARGEWAAKLVDHVRPDIVHVHNFFPKLTPAVHEGAASRGAVVVQTLHNYRLLCAGALFLRDGAICEKCLGASRRWAVVHRCYRGSGAGSLAVVRMQYRAERPSWRDAVHQFIALTEFARTKFIAGGLPADRIAVKPNLAVASQGTASSLRRRGALFVGRLSLEKGVDVLIESWRELPDVELSVVGDGPERQRLQGRAPANVRFLGHLDRAEVQRLMGAAQFLVMPSICYEGFPMVIVEAFAAGLPVVASRIGSLEEIVEPGVNGLLVVPSNPTQLAVSIGQLAHDPLRLERLSRGALATFRQNYRATQNISKLEAIYEAAMKTARAARAR